MATVYREMEEVDFQQGLKLDGVSVTATAAEINKLAGNGVTAADLTKLHAVTATAAEVNKLASIGGSVVAFKRILFSETTGAGTYTGSVTVPGGAVIVDIIVDAVSLWTATTSATMIVGDAANDDGFFTGVNLKATDLLAGESLSFAQAGGKEGAYIANSQVSQRRDPSDRAITAKVTTVGAAGNGGQTIVTVIWAYPTSGDQVTATKA